MFEPATPITSREAVLSSLLAHALVFIFILLNPGILSWRPDRPLRSADPNVPIPVAFLQPAEKEPAMGDTGEKSLGDPRPPDAPPPRNEAPFSRGNTPNRFLAPPVDQPPSPEPGSAGAAQQSPPPAARPEAEREGEEQPEDDRQGAPAIAGLRGQESPGRPDAEGQGGSSEARGRNRPTLKETLGAMSMGHTGAGDPLRYDNPVGGLSGPTGGLSFDTPGFDWGPYARRIYWIIWTNWTRGWPPAARAGLEGMVTVRFRIERSGAITGITVLSESGTPAFDTCATLALEASNPLPPLPDDFPKDSEGITARFLYNMEAPGR